MVSRPGRERAPQWACEWRQFRLLAHDSMRRLLNSAVLSRDADPWQFAIWATVLVQTPPTLYAISVSAKYALLRHATGGSVEHVLLGDRTFFVFYAMTAAALLAALTWEALFPDRMDQEIVGALPVHPRTLAAARLSAAIGMAAVFSAAITLPSTILFAFVAVTHPPYWHIALVVAGHLLGTMGGALCVFLALLLVRGAAAMLLTASAASALAAILQLVSISGLIDAFLYVPSILPRMVDATLSGTASAPWLPPIWFTAMYSVVAGDARDVMRTEAAHGALAIATMLPTVAAVYLLPARWMARRALESSSKQSAKVLSVLTRVTCGAVVWRPPLRPLVTFVIASFTRSRRHVLVVITQLGIGLAIAAVSVIAATVRRTLELHEPAAYLLAVPLVLMFFSALGLRAAYMIPIELDANWPFRLVRMHVTRAAAAARHGMLAMSVLPVALLAGAAALALGWPARTAASAALLDMLAGTLLVECVTYGWHAVPFAREHALSGQSLKWRGLIMVVPLFLFAFLNARAQLLALGSARAAAWYVAVMAGLAIAVRRLSARESMRHELTFDDDGDSLAVLNLSNAL